MRMERTLGLGGGGGVGGGEGGGEGVCTRASVSGLGGRRAVVLAGGWDFSRRRR